MDHIGNNLKLILIIIVVTSLILENSNIGTANNNSYVENTWTKIEPFSPSSNGIREAVAFDENIYALSRVDTGQNLFKKYDPQKDNWTPLTPPPITNSWGSLVACQSKLYLIGGGQRTQVYNPTIDQWENKSTSPKALITQIANVVDDKIYLMSGLTPAAYGVWSPSEETFEYDPVNDSWSTMAPIPTPVGAYASTVLDGKIYIIGGGPATDYHNLNATTLMQIFDPKLNEWTLGQPIPTGVAGAGACSTQGYYVPKRIYVVGGNPWFSASRNANFESGTNLNQVYDLETGKWSSSSPTLESFQSLVLVNVNDVLYAMPYDPNSAERYVPTGYKIDLLPNNGSSNSPSKTDSTLPAPSLKVIEIIAISSIIVVAIASLLIVIRHRKTAN
jgi:hypothetical protein